MSPASGVVLAPYGLCAQCITPCGKTIASVHENCSVNLNNAKWQLSTKIVLRGSPEMMCIRTSSYLFIHHYSVSIWIERPFYDFAKKD